MLVSTPVLSRGSECPLTQEVPTMPKTKLNIIKPLLSLNELSDGDVLHRLHSVYDGMLNNPAYPNTPVDMARFKAVIEPTRPLRLPLSMTEVRTPLSSVTNIALTRSSSTACSDTTSSWRVRMTWKRSRRVVSPPSPR